MKEIEVESVRVEVTLRDGEKRVIELKADEHHPIEAAFELHRDVIDGHGRGWVTVKPGPTLVDIRLSGRVAKTPEAHRVTYSDTTTVTPEVWREGGS